MKTVRLITCENDAQAHILQGALENEGIPAILHNEITARVLNGYIGHLGIDILVQETDYDRALSLLEENRMIPEQLRYCPYCHSDQIRLTYKRKYRFQAFFNMLSGLITGKAVNPLYWEYHCQTCQKNFPKPVSKSTSRQGI
jgi:hypothetical protein